VLGRDHPETLGSVQNLANAYSKQGRYAEAEKLYEETLEIERRVLGQDHPDTLASMYNLACVAARRGNREHALDCLTQAVGHGYKDADWMAKDDDLKSLRGDPAFEALVARARENAAKSK
jgi:pentatricopeptide repeat protein